MTLKKQSIRGLEAIRLNGEVTTKEELITLSESWSENEEITVRKILKQGGKCKVGNNIISVKRPDEIYSLVR
jgi:hypothetical protein